MDYHGLREDFGFRLRTKSSNFVTEVVPSRKEKVLLFYTVGKKGLVFDFFKGEVGKNG